MNVEPATLDLRSARIRIRPWQRRDLLDQELWPGYTDPFNTLWNLPRSISIDDDEPVSFLTAGSRRVWAVEDRQQRLIGRISLREIELGARRARLGISMGAPYVGQGLGTEALVLFLDWFFGPLHFMTMLLDVAAFNQRAVRCYDQLGFRHVGNDWRDAGSDPSLRLLDDPAYREFRPFFRRERWRVAVQFYEMELHRHEWLARPGFGSAERTAY